MALAQLPLKTKAGAGSGISVPCRGQPLCQHPIPAGCRGWGGGHRAVVAAGPWWPWTFGSSRMSLAESALCGLGAGAELLPVCRWGRGSACSPAALAEGRAGHGGCAVAGARRASGGLSCCHTEVAHLAPSTERTNFVPAQVPLS